MAERKSLVRVALGKEKASLVITNGKLVNVYSGELLEGVSIASVHPEMRIFVQDQGLRKK